MTVIGDPAVVGFVLREPWAGSPQHRDVQVWLGGANLSALDSTVYLPTFCTRLSGEIARIASGDLRDDALDGLDAAAVHRLLDEREDQRHAVLCYDITTCSARSYLVDRGATSTVVSAFWDPRHEPAAEIGQVRAVDVDTAELLDVLRRTLEALPTTWV